MVDAATGYFTDVNAMFCRITGNSKDVLLAQKDIRSLGWNPLSQDDFTAYENVIRGNHDRLLRFYQPEKGRGAMPFLKMQVISRITGGYALIILEDIAETRFLNEKWEEYGRWYKYLFDFSPVGLWEEDLSEMVGYLEASGLNKLSFDKAYRFFCTHPEVVEKCRSLAKIIDVNHIVLEQFKITDKALFLKNTKKHLASEQGIAAISYFLAALCAGMQEGAYDSEGVTFTGEPVNFQLRWSFTPDMKRNRYRRVILASIDITALKKTQKALEETAAHIETIIDAIDGIVWTADPQSLKLNFISKKIKEITGYSSRVFLGKKMFDFDVDFFDDQEKMNRFRDKIARGIPGKLQYRIKTKTGEIKWLQINISFIKNREKVLLILGIVIDITDQKLSKAELRRSLRLLSRQNKRLLDFSYIVSHSLRSHSSNLLGLCDLVNHTQQMDEQRKYLELLESVACKLHHVIEGLNQVTDINDP